jgi:CspA family cold shock protein
MSYRDTWESCTSCGKQFVFRVEEQRRQGQRGQEVAPPELCPSCRGETREEHRPEPRRESRPEPTRESPKATDAAALGPGPHEGSVKWFDLEKGYGFLMHPSGVELFFHRTGIVPGEVPDFPDGARVTFCIEHTEKGPQAVEVERMEPDGE